MLLLAVIGITKLSTIKIKGFHSVGAADEGSRLHEATASQWE